MATKQIKSALVSVFSKEGLEPIIKAIGRTGYQIIFYRRYSEVY